MDAHDQALRRRGRGAHRPPVLDPAKLTAFMAVVVLLTAGALIGSAYLSAHRILRDQIDERLSVVAADRQRMLLAVRAAAGGAHRPGRQPDAAPPAPGGPRRRPDRGRPLPHRDGPHPDR